MSSYSYIPPLDQDDDEDFDWDAAVLEIDAVCQSTAATTTKNTFVTPPQPQPPKPPQLLPFVNGWNNAFNKPHNNSRQLTLDRFISNKGASTSNSKQYVEIDENVDQIRVSDTKCDVQIDPQAAQSWIYPDNVPRREYQLAISKVALFSNTLVVLPTGLGKTLIAAVVMYNYFRWFPEGKIVFAAPSRPLVMQQIEACHNIVGIPQEWTIDMTGQTSPPKRASLWRSKRVFFVTPQVLEKDIQSGACLVKYLVCLVIDEAHRAMGNYAYCVAVRELMAVPVQLRILALTATPGSKQQTIQQVIDNLKISTLEYRSESDEDVCPYVHNRKIEVFEVPMGKDAVEINNLLLEAIRPMVTRLCTMGVLQNRDFQTLSPCDLLNSREKFRQAPPPEVTSLNCNEVEGYFGVLITVYHIRKLLSSHGIRPAHEMFENKIRQGYFAKYMSRNESIQKANILMQKSLSHGAPSPKLSKMMDVLVDHFGNNDPQNSRVIIFSNFRGSVSDILDSLAHIGPLVKAIQFIGQSSGKTLKGQTQKIQQAVLEKFRTGECNVIVATSIGEEGLDIMEVDLVICFDANISPLRMIQRMGRTGRKHDGRVVVLACEGTEMKGYKRKLATGKTVRKHMQNGGMNSFNFHCSPRMVPHSYKPELQFVELSIEKFVRHTKKIKTDSPQASKYREKLTAGEAALLNNYFHPLKEPCKLSLIAFPHFQAFPSGVHSVKHSSRVGWLIDAMQHLQGLSSSTGKLFGYDYSRSHCLTAGSIDQHIESRIVAPLPTISLPKKKNLPDTSTQNGSQGHSVGRVQFSVDGDLAETVADDAAIFHSPPYAEIPTKVNIVPETMDAVGRFQISVDGAETVDDDGVNFRTPPYDENPTKGNIVPETIDAVEPESPALPAGNCNLDISDLSPRLTTFIESGFVPESPLGHIAEDLRCNKKDADDVDCHCDAVCCVRSFTSAQKDVTAAAQAVVDHMSTRLNREAEGPADIGENSECLSMQKLRTPLQNLTNGSCSEDWRVSSGEKSGSWKSPKLKRLRKIGDLAEPRPKHNMKVSNCSSADTASIDLPPSFIKHSRVKQLFDDARDFIDEEAEVSSEDVVPDSEDEANHENSDAYEDSFIDDQIDATMGSSQAADSKLDMMAIYRRSLLTQITQSPCQEQQKHSALVSPISVPSLTTIVESGDCSVKTHTRNPHGRPRSNFSGRNSKCSRARHKTCGTISSRSNSPLANKTTDSRKRKLNSSEAFSLPVKNLETEFGSHSDFSSKENKPSGLPNGTNVNWTDFSDDQFYEGIDLDELEAQAAAKLVNQRSMTSMQSKKICEPYTEDTTLLDAPSFDLGI